MSLSTIFSAKDGFIDHFRIHQPSDFIHPASFSHISFSARARLCRLACPRTFSLCLQRYAKFSNLPNKILKTIVFITSYIIHQTSSILHKMALIHLTTFNYVSMYLMSLVLIADSSFLLFSSLTFHILNFIGLYSYSEHSQTHCTTCLVRLSRLTGSLIKLISKESLF